MNTADALMVVYYVVLSGVLVFTRSFKKNSAPDCRGFFRTLIFPFLSPGAQ